MLTKRDVKVQFLIDLKTMKESEMLTKRDVKWNAAQVPCSAVW